MFYQAGAIKKSPLVFYSSTTPYFSFRFFRIRSIAIVPLIKPIPTNNKIIIHLSVKIYSKLLLPPLGRYRCSVFKSLSLSSSFTARRIVDSETLSSFAIVGIDGQHSPFLSARSLRYKKVETALLDTSLRYKKSSLPIIFFSFRYPYLIKRQLSFNRRP